MPCPAGPADQAPLLSLCPPPGLLLATSSLLQRFSLRTWGCLLLTFCSNNTGFHGEALLPKGGVRGYTNTSLIPKRFLFSCGILGSKLVVSLTSQAWSCLRVFALVALLPAALLKCGLSSAHSRFSLATSSRYPSRVITTNPSLPLFCVLSGPHCYPV